MEVYWANFNWSSQHLDCEELRWENGDGWAGQSGRRCGHRAGRRWRDGSIGKGSGRRSPAHVERGRRCGRVHAQSHNLRVQAMRARGAKPRKTATCARQRLDTAGLNEDPPARLWRSLQPRAGGMMDT